MDTGRPDKLHLIGGSEEIRRFRDAVRARIERAAADAGRDLREIPPPVLLSLLCASAFSAMAAASAGLAEKSALGSLSSRVVLGDLISAAIDGVRAISQGRPLSPQDLERELYWRVERVLAAQDQRAAVLRTEIAAVLAETDALRNALFTAIETGNDRLRNDVIAAIDTLSSGYSEMAFLLRVGDQDVEQMQRHLDGQGAEVRTLSEMLRRQSADVRIARADLAAIKHRQSRAVCGGPADAGHGQRWDFGCPYRGLLPFDYEHAQVFCGRQRLTAELVVKLAGCLAGPAMVVVSGASGAGKSSMLHAGLLPVLAAGVQLEGSDRWPRLVMTPTGDPLTELSTRLARLSGGDATAIRRFLAAEPDRADLVVGQAVVDGAGQRNGSRPGRLVLVVDQFEEVFTLAPGRGDAGQQAFIAALCAAASQPFGPRGEPPAIVVVAVRGDFWARCAAHAGLARVMQDGMFIVGPMTDTELRQAITGPADAAGLRVDADLADIILADLRTTGWDEAEGTLPLLSQAMMLTWERRDGRCLTVQGYRETGGVARSVESSAEAVFEALSDAAQQIAREIFQALALVSPDGQLARRAVTRAELHAGRRDAARRMVDTVLEAFASSRLLVLDGDTVQIAHDILLRAWPRLRGWLDSEQANWVLYTQLQEDAAEWAGHGRDSSFLYRGTQLAAVELGVARWAGDPARYPALTGDESSFLEASRQSAARSARTRRIAVLSLALLLVLSIAGIAVAAQADRTANQQRNEALSDQLAAESEALDASNPVTAASLAAAAWKIAPTTEAHASLLDVLAQPVRGTLTASGGTITAIEFSPDGKRLATATDSGAAQIWDPVTRREIGKPLQVGEGEGLASISFGANDVAITTTATGPVRFWDITTRRPIGAPFQVPDETIGIADSIFSPDGKIIAAASHSGDLAFVGTATHHEIGTAVRGAEPLAFSPDGKLLAFSDDSNSHGWVGILDVATRRPVSASMPGSTDYTPAAAFSPDGKVIAVTGQKSVSFWNVSTGHLIGSPLDVVATGVAFSPDGKLVATIGPNYTSSAAATVNLWDAASHEELGGALTVDATAPIVAFSPDSSTLVTANGATVSFWDPFISRQIGALIRGGFSPLAFAPHGQILAAGTLHGADLWNVATRRETGRPLRIGPTDGAQAVAFSPDGKTLAMGGVYGAGAQLWNIATRRRIGKVTPFGNTWVGAIAFSPDGRYLAIGSDSGGSGSGTTWLWDTHTLHLAGRPMKNGNDSISAVAFSPDGSLLATADKQVKMFSEDTQRQVGIPLGDGQETISDMAFSPDGTTIATASDSGVALWNVATHHQNGTSLNVGVGPVEALAFSPDGMILAVAVQDGTIRLWDVASHEQIGSPLVVNHQGVYGIAFSPDGTLLAAASAAIRVWGVALTRDVVTRVCAIAGGSMARHQWSSYVKSEPFQSTCP